jgi:hypothetical protein
MTKSISAPRLAASRLASVLVLVAFVLLSLSCTKKMAPVAPPMARYSAMPSGGGGGGFSNDFEASPATVALHSSGEPDTLATRKIIRNGSLDLLVNDVGQSISKIGSIVNEVGGFVEKSTRTNGGGYSATITVRVPAARLDQIIVDLKGLATSVDRESVEVRDVTRDYIDIDLDARLCSSRRSAIPADPETRHHH